MGKELEAYAQHLYQQEQASAVAQEADSASAAIDNLMDVFVPPDRKLRIERAAQGLLRQQGSLPEGYMQRFKAMATGDDYDDPLSLIKNESDRKLVMHRLKEIVAEHDPDAVTLTGESGATGLTSRAFTDLGSGLRALVSPVARVASGVETGLEAIGMNTPGNLTASDNLETMRQAGQVIRQRGADTQILPEANIGMFTLNMDTATQGALESAIPMLAALAIGKKMPTKGSSAVAQAMVFTEQAYDPLYTDAKEYGFSDAEARLASGVGSLAIGSLETLIGPNERLLGVVRETVGRTVKETAKTWARETGEEVMQDFAETLALQLGDALGDRNDFDSDEMKRRVLSTIQNLPTTAATTGLMTGPGSVNAVGQSLDMQRAGVTAEQFAAMEKRAELREAMTVIDRHRMAKAAVDPAMKDAVAKLAEQDAVSRKDVESLGITESRLTAEQRKLIVADLAARHGVTPDAGQEAPAVQSAPATTVPPEISAALEGVSPDVRAELEAMIAAREEQSPFTLDINKDAQAAPLTQDEQSVVDSLQNIPEAPTAETQPIQTVADLSAKLESVVDRRGDPVLEDELRRDRIAVLKNEEITRDKPFDVEQKVKATLPNHKKPKRVVITDVVSIDESTGKKTFEVHLVDASGNAKPRSRKGAKVVFQVDESALMRPKNVAVLQQQAAELEALFPDKKERAAAKSSARRVRDFAEALSPSGGAAKDRINNMAASLATKYGMREIEDGMGMTLNSLDSAAMRALLEPDIKGWALAEHPEIAETIWPELQQEVDIEPGFDPDQIEQDIINFPATIFPQLGPNRRPLTVAKAALENIKAAEDATLSAIDRDVKTGVISAEEGDMRRKQTRQDYRRAVREAESVVRDAERRQSDRREKRENKGPRQRGDVWVRKELLQALHNGTLDAAGVEFADWLLTENPHIANDLAISIRKPREDGPFSTLRGWYMDAIKMVVLYKNSDDTLTATHEILHHTERMLPPEAQDAVSREWKRAYDRAISKAKTQERKDALAILPALNHSATQERAMKALQKAEAAGHINMAEDYRLVNPSEWFAVNATGFMQGRYNARKSVIAKAKQWMRELLEKAKSLLGFSGSGQVAKALDSIINGDGKFQSEKMLSDKGDIFAARDFTQKEQARFDELLAQAVAELEAQGKDPSALLTLGRPDLANPGGAVPEARALANAVDAQRTEMGEPAPQTVAGWTARAEAMVAADPQGLLDRMSSQGVNANDPVDVIASQILLQRLSPPAFAANDTSTIVKLHMVMRNIRGGGSEMGRAMRARHDTFKTPVERARQYLTNAILDVPADRHDADPVTREDEAGRRLQLIREAFARDGVDFDSITDEQLSDPNFVARLVRIIQTIDATLGDKAYEFWINAILSGPKTQAANLVGNTANLAIEYGLQRPLEAAVRTATGELGAIPDYLAGAKAAAVSIPLAWRNMRQAFDIEDSVHVAGDVRANTKLEGRTHRKAIGGKKGRWIRFPTRMLIAADEFFRTVIWHGEVMEKARRQARREGLKSGSEGFANRVAEQIANPMSDAAIEAWMDAARLTFTNDPENSAKLFYSIGKWVAAAPYGGKWVAPFVRTPANIIGAGLEKIPIISVMTAANEIRNGKPVKDVLVRRGVETALGTALMMLVATMLGSDDDEPRITGTPPEGAAGRAFAYRNLPPMSVRVGDRWYSYSRIEPLATPLGIMVDTMNAHRSADGMTGAKVWEATKNVVREKAFLQSIGDIIKAMEEGERGAGKAEAFAARFLSSWVPNLVRQPIASMDGHVRQKPIYDEDMSWGARVLSGAAQKSRLVAQPPPRVDHWGRDITTVTGGLQEARPYSDVPWRLLSPVTAYEADLATDVDRMITRWNNMHEDDPYYPNTPNASMTVNGVLYQMTSDEYYEMLKIRGEAARDMMERQRWNFDEPTDRDIKRVKDVFKRAGTIARARVRSKVMSGP